MFASQDRAWNARSSANGGKKYEYTFPQDINLKSDLSTKTGKQDFENSTPNLTRH